MATTVHCAYCFENLAARLEKRKPLSFDAVEFLWAKYESSGEEDEEADPESHSGEEGEGTAVEANSDNTNRQDDGDNGTARGAAIAADASAAYRPAAVSRLLPLSSHTSSSSSLPSASSSTPSLSTNASSTTPPTSTSSSRSSFFSLPARLSGRQKHRSRGNPDDSEKFPLFVTWNTISSRSGQKSLRGCIGTFEPQELDEGLQSYALTSAFDDNRFSPISVRELASLECGVTLLTDFEPTTSPMDWTVGTHGLRISFTHHGRRYGATYLPDVAREQGWSKDETLVSLMRKAGWSGRREDWRKVDGLDVVRYQGRRASLSYREWREWRDWVERTKGEELDS